MRRLILTTLLAASLSMALSGCGPDRKAADHKLSMACMAAIKALSDPEDTFDLQNESFASQKQQDLDLRTVTLDTHYTHDHGIISDKTYSCTFEEHAGFFGYKPQFYSLEKDDVKYGNVDGTIQGDLEAMTKINNAVEPILY